MFAKKLQAARNAAGLSQSQAALAMGRPASTLRKWEQGVNVPHPTIQAAALAAMKSAKRKSRKAENASDQATEGAARRSDEAEKQSNSK